MLNATVALFTTYGVKHMTATRNTKRTTRCLCGGLPRLGRTFHTYLLPIFYNVTLWTTFEYLLKGRYWTFCIFTRTRACALAPKNAVLRVGAVPRVLTQHLDSIRATFLILGSA